MLSTLGANLHRQRRAPVPRHQHSHRPVAARALLRSPGHSKVRLHQLMQNTEDHMLIWGLGGVHHSA